METSKYLRHFWTHRPPYVVFLLCLTCFGLTLFSLSVFVAQTDRLANPDVLDWNKLLNKLKKLEYCLPLPKTHPLVLSEEEVQKNQSNWTSAFLAVDFAPDLLADFRQFNFQTQVQVNHLGRGIRPEFQNDVIIVTFYFTDDKLGGKEFIKVEGSPAFLKHLSNKNSSNFVAPSHDQQKSTVKLLSHSTDHKPATWCQEHPSDSSISLDFQMDYNSDLTMYVSEADKELIHLHLMVTSVFMFAILAIVIIAFLVRNLTSNKRFIHGEDNRGDHHMIVMTQLSTSEE